jgi:hypothetical protein
LWAVKQPEGELARGASWTGWLRLQSGRGDEGFSELRFADSVARPEPRAVTRFRDVVGAASG